MLTSGNINELYGILNANNNNPHNFLGMHKEEVRGISSIAIRTFNPIAKSIFVLDLESNKKYEMELVHTTGFFEIIIPKRDFFNYKYIIETYENQYESYDPYSFLPQISDYDIYLFNSGTHYEIFNKLGANCAIVNGIEGVIFGVWAPNAINVSVIGDFNNWDGRRNPMRILGNSGVFELFIPYLREFDKYKFEIKDIYGKITQKTDPYGFMQEHRPSTASLVYDINGYEWKDKEWVKDRENKDILNSPINIYEVHMGSFKKPKDREFYSYRELEDLLIPYVKEMGYTHIELMPISEYPFDGSWGYQVTGYFAPTSRFGTPKEFMSFIDKCHQEGIGVILDWVPGHFPKDGHGLANFDGTALYEHMDPRQGEHQEWGTLIFNYSRNEVRNFLISNATYWIEKYHIDGLRVDAVASMLYLDYCRNEGQWVPNKYGGRENLDAVEFLKHLNSIISNRYKNILMCAEESTSWEGVTKPAKYDGLGFNLKWNMGWMNDFLEYMEKDCVYRKYHHNNLTFSMVYAYTENFIEVLSHDEVVHGKRSLIDKMPGDIWQKCANHRLALAYTYAHTGKSLTFMGSEFGHFREWSENRELDWFLLDIPHHKQIQSFVRDLNHLYKDNGAFWENDFNSKGFSWISCDDAERSLLFFLRSGKKDSILVFCNFTPATYRDFEVCIPMEGQFIEVLNSDSALYGGSEVTNTSVIKSYKDENGTNFIKINIPPLGVSFLKLK